MMLAQQDYDRAFGNIVGDPARPILRFYANRISPKIG